MAGQTVYYGLSTLEAGDRLSDDDYKYTTRDRRIIDRAGYLGAEGHVHDGDDADVVDPEDTLGYTIDTSSGYLPSGKTARYKFTWVDEHGAETAASPEIAVTLPSALTTPGVPVLTRALTGGTMLAGQYFYMLSAWETVNTQETTAGRRAWMTLPSGTSTGEITITFPTLPPGADGFNIYKRGPGGNQFVFLDSVDLSVATPPTAYVDDGTVDCNVVRTAPRTNSTLSGNSVELSLPGSTPAAPDGYTWKVYRTFQLGDWEHSLLHWVTEETSEGSGIITPTLTDTGTTTSQGEPPEVSEIIGSPEKIDLTSHVEGILPIAHLPVPFDAQYLNNYFQVTFVEPGDAEVENSKQIWVCEYDEVEIIGCRAYLGRDSSPAVSNLIVDVNKWSGATPTWTTIYTTQSNRPVVPVGDMVGSRTLPDVTELLEGEALSIDVDQIGGGATPTDEQVTVNVYMKIVNS